MSQPTRSSLTLSPIKRTLLNALLAEEQIAPSAPLRIPPRPPSDTPPLSFAQERLWFLEQLDGPSAVYNVTQAFRLAGTLDIPALEASLNAVIARHEALRTTFPLANGRPFQAIATRLAIPLPLIDLANIPPEERLAAAMAHAQQEATRPFDLVHGPLIRVHLLRLAQDDYVLVLALHHIVCDEWSMDVLFREMAVHYEAALSGAAPALAALPIHYADVACWQRERFAQGDLDNALAYWSNALADLPVALDLPLDRPRADTQTFAGANEARTLSFSLLDGLSTLGQQAQVTLFTTLLSAFAVLLHRYTGQDEFAVGSPIANRQHRDVEGLIGLFLNTLVLRCSVADNPTFRVLLARTHATVLASFDHGEFPFEKLVETLQPARDRARTPLFQTMFVLQQGVGQALSLPGLTVTRVDLPRTQAKFDLTLFAVPVADGLRLNVEYNTALFEVSTIRRLLDHFTMLLNAVVANPDAPTGTLPLLTPAERQQIVERWNTTQCDYPHEHCLHHLFEAQVQRTPDAIAVQCGEARLTYRELESRANQLAHHLATRGVGTGVVVGLALPRSLDLMVSVLAILKTGGAVLPLDPTYPAARLAFMLEDSRAAALITTTAESNTLLPFAGSVVRLDRDRSRITAYSAEPPPCDATGDHLLYLLYTSGSTGQPKGVEMPHRSLVNLVCWQQTQPRLGAPARTLQFTSINFDVAFQELFTTWHTGGTLVMMSDEARRDPHALLNILRTERIERLYLPFVALQQLAEVAARVEQLPAHLVDVITAGEQLRSTPQLRDFFARLDSCVLHNHYGPTETHVATTYTLTGPPEQWPSLPPIGRPIANTQVYLLDRYGQPVPVGMVGELHIGGVCLAYGYRHRAKLTAERFISLLNCRLGISNSWLSAPTSGKENPQSKIPNHKLYRTGDLARLRADGTIDYLGRRDQQVKIRGYRVEMGEVEVVLGQHPAVAECVVMAQTDTLGSQHLIAYFIIYRGIVPTSAELRNFMRERLPGYMVPAAFVRLDRWPMTPSGKVDRLRLPAPDGQSVARTHHATPRHELDTQLAAIWCELLGLDEVGIHDNFFALGGHSLLAIRLFASIEEVLGQRFPIGLLFQAPTIAELANALRSAILPARVPTLDATSHEWSTVTPIQPHGSQPPLFCVHGYGGGVVGYAALAARLGSEQPVYGLQAYGLDGCAAPDTTIEEMAARYVEAMRQVQSSGPYRIGGYCLGGVVAFEMARQLYARGEQVAHLAILEGYAPIGRAGRISLGQPKQLLNVLRNLPFWLDDYMQQGLAEMCAAASRRARVLGLTALPGISHLLTPRPEDIIGADAAYIPAHVRTLMDAQIRAQIAYRPAPYEGDVTLYRVRRLSLLRSGDPCMGWSHIARHVSLRIIDGRHNNLLEEPHVASLAAQLHTDLVHDQSHSDG